MTPIDSTVVIVPWHNEKQLALFLDAWGISGKIPDWVLLTQDSLKQGCARTKNRGIENARKLGAEVAIILDDDCFPDWSYQILENFVKHHLKAFEPQQVRMFQPVTDPPSRGTPYLNHHIEMPVAASMGFWTHVGDYDACGQLIHGATKPMQFKREPIYGRYFPLCGMNLAFRLSWWPWCQFIDVPRFDDIFSGYIFQRKAYAEGYCFNLNGPIVEHSRQSDVFANLRAEAPNMERNETIWRDIATTPLTDYETFRARVGL